MFFIKSFRKNNMSLNDVQDLLMNTSAISDNEDGQSKFDVLSLTFSENNSSQKRFSMKYSDKLKIQKSDVVFLNMFDSKVLESLDTDTPSAPFPIVNYSGDVWFDSFRNKSVLFVSPTTNNNAQQDSEYDLNAFLINNLLDKRFYYDGFFMFSIYTKNKVTSNVCNLMIKVASEPYFKFTDSTTSIYSGVYNYDKNEEVFFTIFDNNSDGRLFLGTYVCLITNVNEINTSFTRINQFFNKLKEISNNPMILMHVIFLLSGGDKYYDSSKELYNNFKSLTKYNGRGCFNSSDGFYTKTHFERETYLNYNFTLLENDNDMYSGDVERTLVDEHGVTVYEKESRHHKLLDPSKDLDSEKKSLFDELSLNKRWSVSTTNSEQ